MDIPNVDLVIVYGVPKNMSEMYQVHVIKRILKLHVHYHTAIWTSR